MFHDKTPFVCLAMLATTVSTTALAQATSAPDERKAVEEEASSSDIIVTARKREERLQDVPITITTQTAAQLQSSGVQTTKDLTKVVPGLVFAQNESSSQPAIRGVTSSIVASGGENPVAIYLDGIYQPFVGGALYDLPDVDRIEVLKGPQGTLFGRNATGGAIQIFTRQPSYTTTGQFTISNGIYTGGSARTADEVSVSGFLSGPIVSDKLAYSLSGSYRYNPGYMTNDVTGRRSGKQRAYTTRLKLLWEPSSSTKFLLSGYYSNLYDVASYNRAPANGVSIGSTFADAIVPAQPWHVAVDPDQPNFARIKVYGISLKADVDTSIGTFTSMTGYLKANNPNFVNASAVYSPSCQAAFSCLSYDYRAGSESFTQELNFNSKKFSIFTLTAGLFYYHNFGSFQTTDVYGGVSNSLKVFGYSHSVKTDAYAAFAEINADVTDNIHILLGGRYGREKLHSDSFLTVPTVTRINIPGRTDSAFTPRASIRYSFDRSASAYFTYSKGFRSGLVGQPFDPLLSAVAPETLNSYEVGFKIAKPLFSFNASYYHYDYSNLQLTKYIGALPTPQNAASAKMDGFDVDGFYRVTPSLKLNIAFNYMPRADFVNYQDAPLFQMPVGGFAAPITTPGGDASGLRVIRAPKFSGSAGIDWQHEYAFGKIGANASVYHSSSLKWDVAGAIVTKPYEDVGAQIFYEKQGVRFTIFGRNLLNKAAINGSQPSDSVFPVLYIPPRQIGFSINYSF